jgi:hypothetical protein
VTLAEPLQTGAKQMTRARLLWDAQALYVGFDADDVDITAQYQQRDDPTCRDDAVEIFINPNPQQEVATSLRGTLNVRTDVDSGWSLEAMIPWPNFEELSRRPPIVGRCGQ